MTISKYSKIQYLSVRSSSLAGVSSQRRGRRSRGWRGGSSSSSLKRSLSAPNKLWSRKEANTTGHPGTHLWTRGVISIWAARCPQALEATWTRMPFWPGVPPVARPMLHPLPAQVSKIGPNLYHKSFNINSLHILQFQNSAQWKKNWYIHWLWHDDWYLMYACQIHSWIAEIRLLKRYSWTSRKRGFQDVSIFLWNECYKKHLWNNFAIRRWVSRRNDVARATCEISEEKRLE